jgi:hypothetical protein
MEAELYELTRLSRNVAVLYDSERMSEGAPPLKGRAEFGEMCRKFGFSVCMTECRAIENYLTDRAVKEEFGHKYSAPAPFVRLGDHHPSWSKAETWRIARRMTKDEIIGTDVGRFLESL